LVKQEQQTKVQGKRSLVEIKIAKAVVIKNVQLVTEMKAISE
jgi:hypothetical protein